MTVKEFFESKGIDINNLHTVDHGLPYDPNGLDIQWIDVEGLILEFTKFNVQEALKAAAEKATYNWMEHTVRKDSILTAYPLENIK